MSVLYLGFDARRVRHWTDALGATPKFAVKDRKAAIEAAKTDGFVIVFAFNGTDPEDLILNSKSPVIDSSLYQQAERQWRKRV